MNPLVLKFLPYGLGIGLIALAVLWFGDHERAVERAKIAAQNYQQLAEAKVKADQETQRLQGIADEATKRAEDSKKSFDEYMAAHPIGHVFVCPPAPSSQHGPPADSASDGGDAGAGAGPEAGGAVPGGSPSAPIDIGPELDTIVSGFASLAIELAHWQQRPIAQ